MYPPWRGLASNSIVPEKMLRSAGLRSELGAFDNLSLALMCIFASGAGRGRSVAFLVAEGVLRSKTARARASGVCRHGPLAPGI